MRVLRFFKELPGRLPRGTAVAVPLTVLLEGLAVSRLDFWFLEWFALVPVLVLLGRTEGPGAFALGWAAGSLAHLVFFRWLAGTVIRFTSFPLPIAVGVLVLFALAHGLLWGAWFFLADRLARKGRWPFAAAVASAYVACAGHLPQLFPWWVGMAQHHFTWLAQAADLGGEALVSALTVAANAALAGMLGSLLAKERPAAAPALLALAAVAAACIYGWARAGQIRKKLDAAPAVPLALVQPYASVEEEMGWARPLEKMDRLLDLHRRAAAQGARLVVFPEAALPFIAWGGALGYRQVTSQDLRMSESLVRAVQDSGVPLVTGAVAIRGRNYTNSALALYPVPARPAAGLSPGDLLAGRYDKVGLLAFGERLPFRPLLAFLERWIPPLGDGFLPGEGPVTFQAGELSMAASICYEAIWADLTRQALLPGGNVLLNLTNDAWFGEGDERHQHWTLSLWRAIENRVWLVRATNTGRTSVVDPLGREQARAAEEGPAVLRAEVRPIREASLYRKAGGWFEVLCAALAAAGIFSSALRRRRRGATREGGG